MVMDKTDYESKLDSMLEDRTTYLPLTPDPAKECERKLKKLVAGIKDRLPDTTLSKICTTDGNTPRFYGIPKLHKKDVPLRPIVSFIGSTTYQLSKHLARLLSSLVGNSPYTVRNSKEWRDFAANIKLRPDEELVSFDVISLFTSIPTDVAIAEAKVRLETDQQLTERTQLTTTDISTLLTFCLS